MPAPRMYQYLNYFYAVTNQEEGSQRKAPTNKPSNEKSVTKIQKSGSERQRGKCSKSFS